MAKQLHPFCNICGWRKGGADSWDGARCKCGHYEPPIEVVHAEHCATRSGGYNAGRCNCVETHDEYGGTTGAPLPGYAR